MQYEDSFKVFVRIESCDGSEYIDVYKMELRKWRRGPRKITSDSVERNPVVGTQREKQIHRAEINVSITVLMRKYTNQSF